MGTSARGKENNPTGQVGERVGKIKTTDPLFLPKFRKGVRWKWFTSVRTQGSVIGFVETASKDTSTDALQSAQIISP